MKNIINLDLAGKYNKLFSIRTLDHRQDMELLILSAEQYCQR